MRTSKLWVPLAGLFLLSCAPMQAAAGASSDGLPGLSSQHAVTNRAWLLGCSFLMFAMQAGFALMETGMTRAKNVAHTMAMNVLVFACATIGFWACGFGFMYGNVGSLHALGGEQALASEVAPTFGGKAFGLLGFQGFFLAGGSADAGLLTWFLFQLMFLDTAVTIPTGALAERWSFRSFILFSLFAATILYPIYGNWVWGNGWLAHLGLNFGLGHGHVDFAGSTVVHMVGGVTSLIGTLALGPRIGKFRPDGTPNPLPAHSIPLYMLGTLLLVFGWFGFNSGGIHVATDANVARVAVNTVLASSSGALASMAYIWLRYGKPDPSFICNGTLAGLVAITASCAFVAPWAAVVIGLIAGCLVVASALYVERKLRIDDPVGAISVHGTNGVWGALALGLFADGTYAPRLNFNDVPGNVTGLFYGDASQLAAQCIGVLANLLWVAPMSYLAFRLLNKLVGNRVTANIELQGLDVPELGALGYVAQEAKLSEAHLTVTRPAEPRAAIAPPNLSQHFTIVVEGADLEQLAQVWSDLCQSSEESPPEFLQVYPHMTWFRGNRFRFRSGDAQTVRNNLERVLQQRLAKRTVRTRLEK